MFLLGGLLALFSRAQTPMTPMEGLRRSSLPFLAVERSLAGLELAAAVLPLILR